MKISDLDEETRSIVYLAHIIARKGSPRNAMAKLRAALKAWDSKHERERATNLIRAIFDTPNECRCKYDAMCCPVHDPIGARD